MGRRKEGAVALPTDLKRKNYLSILNTFRSGKAMSANEVSEKTGISRQTVMKAVNHFMEKGLLSSAGKGESTEIGGKKPELFQFDMERYLLCIGLSGNEMAVCLYDLTGRLVGKEEQEFRMEVSLEDFFYHIERMSEKLLNQAEKGRELLYGVSLFVGGVLENGVLRHFALLPEWGNDIPLKEMLEARFPNTEVVVENVARMAACAAVLDNPEYEKRRVAVIYTDMGISACYIDNSRVVRGANGLIGEIGTMVLSLTEAKAYARDSRSYFSHLVGEKYLKELAQADKALLKKSSLASYGEELSIKDIFKEAEEGDPLAKEIVSKAAWSFSAAFYNVMLGFEPEVIIVQGNYAHAGTWFEQCVKKGIACFPGVSEEPFLMQYDKRPLMELQMIGATKLLMKHFFESSEWL